MKPRQYFKCPCCGMKVLKCNGIKLMWTNITICEDCHDKIITIYNELKQGKNKIDMEQKIYDALIDTDISNIVLNCINKLKMFARFVDEKIDNGLDNGDYLMMRSYDLTDRDENIFHVRCYFPRSEDTITDIDVQRIEDNY